MFVNIGQNLIRCWVNFISTAIHFSIPKTMSSTEQLQYIILLSFVIAKMVGMGRQGIMD